MLNVFLFLSVITFSSINAQKTHVLLVSTVTCQGKACAYGYAAEADVFRAYHLLRKRGISDDSIIFMTTDDFVNNSLNPWPGHLYDSQKKDLDLHKDVQIDYSGKYVTRENILSILMGDKERVKGGNGRVFQSSRDDNIFIFLAGHGDYGSLLMPDHFRITTLDLQQMIQTLHDKHHYKHILFYIMACLSGSLFTELDPKYNVLALTSTNASEFSAGLKPVEIPEASKMGGKISFATEFGHAWMNALSASDPDTMTIGEQIEKIRKSPVLSSHPTTYGNMDILKEKISSFQGKKSQ